MATESHIYRMSSAGGMTSDTRYPNMLTNYGDFGAMQRIAYANSVGTSTAFFANIPQNYQDLRLVIFSRSTFSASLVSLYHWLNGDTGANYSYTFMSGDGASATSGRGTNSGIFYSGYIPGATSTSGIFAATTIDILNYSNTSTYKTVIAKTAGDQNGSGRVNLWANLWRNTNAITSFGIGTDGNVSFASGTTVALYGIRAGNS